MPRCHGRAVNMRVPSWVQATLALLVGSVVAALVHVSIGFVAPAGFLDLGRATPSNVLLAFGTAWFFSALITVPVGGLVWRPLHRYAYDGFVSYGLIAVVSYLVLHIAVGLADFSFIGIGAAVGNAVGVRCIERVLALAERSNSSTSGND